MTDPGRPPLSQNTTSYFVRIVETWRANPNGKPRTINVYSNAPYISLSGGGLPAPSISDVPSYGLATFSAVPFSSGSSLTAEALASDKTTVVAKHVVHSWGTPTALQLTLDAPSLATGTGSKVYLDGGDVALLRASVVDESGNLCWDATLPLFFSVTSGPGFVWGTGNGDPSDQVKLNSNNRTTYHGLARAVVRAALVGIGSDAERAQLAYVNTDAGRGMRTAGILGGGASPPTQITVQVSSPGIPSATLEIPLSTALSDSVLSVAGASVGVADVGE